MTPDFSSVTSGSSTTAPPPVPYGTIPYQLSPIEVENWLFAFGSRPTVRNYLATGEPPWGIIERATLINPNDSDFLLFIPTLGGVADPRNLRVTLVTDHPIVEEVKKAPFQSPDDVGFFENLKAQLDSVIGGAQSFAKWAVVGLVAYAVLQLTRK